ncbi:MAG: hypothetical protein C0501_30910 [Isosphaera sp.]|nr:hypothetical protein [Isosphaera sp.]
MLPTYPAVLTDDRLEWSGETPPGLTGRVRVYVTLLDPPPTPHADRGNRAVAALERLAALGGLSSIPDPLAREREQREDRDLPGRAD